MINAGKISAIYTLSNGYCYCCFHCESLLLWSSIGIGDAVLNKHHYLDEVYCIIFLNKVKSGWGWKENDACTKVFCAQMLLLWCCAHSAYMSSFFCSCSHWCLVPACTYVFFCAKQTGTAPKIGIKQSTPPNIKLMAWMTLQFSCKKHLKLYRWMMQHLVRWNTKPS